MIVNKQLAESKGVDQKDLWETPAHIFEPLNKEFRFTLDPCCTNETRKCNWYLTPKQDGLSVCWKDQRVFVNPPYSRDNIDKWVEKCWKESKHATVVALLPVSTSAKWWHRWIVGKAELRFIERRVRFVGAPYTAPFSSVIAVFGGAGVKSYKQQKLFQQ
jgi:phage N-6-adenine-methyltransferase